MSFFLKARARAQSHRTQRLRLTWILVVPFLYFATPTWTSLWGSLLLVVPGLLLRAVSAGYIEKDRVLTVVGPYAYLRHPLYTGSFLVGLGLCLAGGKGWFLPVYLICFALLYGRTIRIEDRDLAENFGEPYREYRRQVPAFFPRRVLSHRRYLQNQGETSREWFAPALFLRNREWEAVLGVAGGWALLLLKLWFPG